MGLAGKGERAPRYFGWHFSDGTIWVDERKRPVPIASKSARAFMHGAWATLGPLTGSTLKTRVLPRSVSQAPSNNSAGEVGQLQTFWFHRPKECCRPCVSIHEVKLVVATLAQPVY